MLLWPEADESHAQLSLRQTLLRLRQAIGTDADEHHITTGNLVRLDLGPDGSLDVTAMVAALEMPEPRVTRALLHEHAPIAAQSARMGMDAKVGEQQMAKSAQRDGDLRALLGMPEGVPPAAPADATETKPKGRCGRPKKPATDG